MNTYNKTDHSLKIKHCPKCDTTKALSEFPLMKGKLYSWCHVCNRANGKQYREGKRRLAIYYYSRGTNQCAICTEDRFLVLDLDHINGGGHQARKTENSSRLYARLAREDYPEGFRVLCRNCNWLEWHRKRSEVL